MSEWIAVANGLPDDDCTVLIALDDGEVWTGYLDGDSWFYVSGNEMEAKVTHWQHLPAPPPQDSERPTDGSGNGI